MYVPIRRALDQKQALWHCTPMDPYLEKYLKKVREATPTLKETGDSDGIKIIIHEGNIVSGYVSRTAQGCSAFLEELRVFQDSARGHGIGSRLVRTFFRHCADMGVEYVDSDLLDSTALRNRGRIFGETALHFIEETDDGEVELPLNLPQATASLDRAGEVWEVTPEEELARLSPGILVRVYLADVDTSGWEVPVRSEW